jgi:hypothetical protein
MADQLYVSYWLRGFTTMNMLQQFERTVSKFPFSKLTKAEPVLRVYAVSFGEAPVLETAFPNPPDPAAIGASAREFLHNDTCVQLEAAWDLWLHDTDWKLQPSRVLIESYAPDFEDAERDENLRIELGLDSKFLPSPEREALPMIRANIQSLLRLVHDLDDTLPVERRLLWSESGDNFAARLEAALRPAT